jgi:hypothetical protein
LLCLKDSLSVVKPPIGRIKTTSLTAQGVLT